MILVIHIYSKRRAQFHDKTEATERQTLLNVSAQLSISGEPYTNVSLLFLEGLYDPVVEKMYLIGCREIHALGCALIKRTDLEGGLDCMIEVKVEYPPKTAAWLDLTAKISITSQRNKEDMLYFSPVKLTTTPILYPGQSGDMIVRKCIAEEVLILTLIIGCCLYL